MEDIIKNTFDINAKEMYYCKRCGYISFYPILRPFQEIINCQNCDDNDVVIIEDNEVKK